MVLGIDWLGHFATELLIEKRYGVGMENFKGENAITPQQIINGLRDKNLLLTSKNDELKILSEKKAEAEREYNKKFAEIMLRKKEAGMSVTLIKELTKGDDIVSDYKFKLDIADAIYQACKESIKSTITQIDSYRSILSFLKSELESR